MMKHVSQYSGLSLRRLWPAVSGKLYPETRERVLTSLKEVRKLAEENPACVDHDTLIATLEHLQEVLGMHYDSLAVTADSRLKAQPYGAQKYPADYFTHLCEALVMTSAELKNALQKIRALARACFAKAGSSAQAKLALARLNAAEQDLNYLLFVEQQYVRPLLMGETDS